MLGKTGCTMLAFPCVALLDFSFMQPLKTYHAQEIEIWMKSHPSTDVTHYQTGWESFSKVGHNSHCCRRDPENRLVAL